MLLLAFSSIVVYPSSSPVITVLLQNSLIHFFMKRQAAHLKSEPVYFRLPGSHNNAGYLYPSVSVIVHFCTTIA